MRYLLQENCTVCIHFGSMGRYRWTTTNYVYLLFNILFIYFLNKILFQGKLEILFLLFFYSLSMEIDCHGNLFDNLRSYSGGTGGLTDRALSLCKTT